MLKNHSQLKIFGNVQVQETFFSSLSLTVDSGSTNFAGTTELFGSQLFQQRTDEHPGLESRFHMEA